MPIDKEACAKLMISKCEAIYKQYLPGHSEHRMHMVYGFTDGRLIFLCGQIIEMCVLDSEMWKKECERLAKVVERLQDEYYKINPPYRNPKLDNL